jgi:hypothetical protein
VVIAPVLTRIEMLRIATTYELCITRHHPVAVEAGHRPKLRAEELFRGAQGYLGQGQGFERLRATAVLHALRRGDRTARRIRRGGKGRDGWNDVLGLLASTLLAVSSAAATVAARRRRNPHGPTRHCRGGRTEAAC